MTLSGFARAMGRRTLAAAALAAVVGTGTAWAQEQPADPFKFSADAAVMVYTIKPESTADFEAMWATIKTKLAASEKPELKQLGESLRIYKVAAGATADGQTYFFIADPASKTVSYSLSPFLLFTSGLFTREEADALFKKVNAAINGLNAIPLGKL